MEVALVHENTTKNIDCLPNETLSQIFTMHRELPQCDFEWADDTLPSIPISHVSRRWRNTALSTAMLWSTLVSSPAHLHSFYRTMLQRSRQSLLKIVITVDKTGIGPNLESATILSALMVSESHRLRRLLIDAPYPFISHHLASVHSLSAPHIVCISVRNRRDAKRGTRNENQYIPRIFSGGTERLLRFETIDINLTFRPPLGSLHTLNLIFSHFVSTIALSETLIEASQSINRLLLGFSKFYFPITPIAHTTMPYLTSLELHATSFTSFALLETFTAPSLETLSLYLLQGHTSQPLSGLQVQRIAARFHNLHTLHLTGELHSGILAAFPTITRLIISDDRYTPTVLRDVFDANQHAFATLTAELALVVASEKFKKPISTFCAARQSLGLLTPTFEAELGNRFKDADFVLEGAW